MCSGSDRKGSALSYMYDLLMIVRAMYNVTPCFGFLFCENESFVCWLPVDDEFAKTTTIESYSVLLDASKASAIPVAEHERVLHHSQPLDMEEISQPFDGERPAKGLKCANIIAGTVLKCSRAHFAVTEKVDPRKQNVTYSWNSKSNSIIENAIRFALLPATFEVRLDRYPDFSSDQTMFVIEEMELGREGSTSLVCSEDGASCVFKWTIEMHDWRMPKIKWIAGRRFSFRTRGSCKSTIFRCSSCLTWICW